MSDRSTSTFEVVGWEQATYDEPDEGPRLARVTVKKVFHGALQGESIGEALLCQSDPGDLTAGGGYLVSERFVGQLDGRRGSFVMQHGGIGGDGVASRTFGAVVPGSGTGSLRGLRAVVEVAAEADGTHTLTLRHDVD